MNILALATVCGFGKTKAKWAGPFALVCFLQCEADFTAMIETKFQPALAMSHEMVGTMATFIKYINN